MNIKNLFSVLSLALLVSSSAQALELNRSYSCNVLNPSAHPDFHGYVYSAQIGQEGQDTALLSVKHSATQFSEEVQAPIRYGVGSLVLTLAGVGTAVKEVTGSWDHGDTWVSLKYSKRDRKFVGTLTLEEDFAYQVACTERVIVFESGQ